MPLTQRLWDNLCTYHFHTNVCVFWSTRNPYDNLLPKKKKKIHMIRTSLYIYVIKCMALKRVINLFDCFKFFFLSLFLPFIFILNLFNFLKYWKIWQNLLVIRTQLIIINKWDFFCIPLDVMGNHVSIHRSNYSHTHLAHNKFFSSNSLF